jgi:hypothetical protein
MPKAHHHLSHVVEPVTALICNQHAKMLLLRILAHRIHLPQSSIQGHVQRHPGEFIGGPLMIILLALMFRVFLKRRMVDEAREQAEKGVLGSMEGHAEMDMSVAMPDASVLQRLRSPEGFTATAGYFVMDWAAIWKDIAGGLLIAGALAAWVPDSFWQRLFLAHDPTLAKAWGPLIGPAVAIISFVCSIGNVPLAAVLWNGGISFGGVLAFIFADLIILPILDIYRRYYGWKMAGFLLATFYATMALAGLNVELLFQAPASPLRSETPRSSRRPSPGTTRPCSTSPSPC